MKKWPLLLFAAAGLALTVRPIDTIAQPLPGAGGGSRKAANESLPQARMKFTSVRTDTSALDAMRYIDPKGALHAHYTVANTHSHNDYEQRTPFWLAWDEQFGSIEADIWLVDGVVLVGHDRKELATRRTLEAYYLKPLAACVQKNNGHPYADTARKLQMLIDVKADSVNTLAALIALLNKYPSLEHTPAITWVISGNRPSPALYPTYPPFIAFDGILHDRYTPKELARIAMMSDDLKYYTGWDPRIGIPDTARKILSAAVRRSHELHLPVRFWDAPDFPKAWRTLEDLHVDYINTDHIHELASWLYKNQ